MYVGSRVIRRVSPKFLLHGVKDMKPLKTRVVHLTSAHGRYDTRIFLKMCSSLASYGYDMSLVVADGEGDEVKNGVTIFDVGPKPRGRLSRMTKTVNDVLKKAIYLNGDIYHLHDPELMPVGIKLKKLGKKVYRTVLKSMLIIQF